MSSWDTNHWSNFCDPQGELICCNKWQSGTSEISTPPEIAIGMHFHARTWALKLCWYFYLLMEKPLRRYFQVQSLYYQVAQCHQKKLIPVSSRWQVRCEKAKKGLVSILPPVIINIHLTKPVSTDLTLKPDSVLVNPIEKDGVRSWSM